MPNKIKVPIPVNGGVNTQASPSQEALKKLRNARNAFYRRDDQTLRRRPDLSSVAGGAVSSIFTIQGSTFFGDTNKTFRHLVWFKEADVGFGLGGSMSYMDTEAPGTVYGLTTTIVGGSNGYTGLRKPVQYNNILYWPSSPNSAGVVGVPLAWNGTTSNVREAGIDIGGNSGTSFTINVAGAGALTFTTGRSYTYTLYDPVSGIESMPLNNGTTLTTVNTGVIAAKVPVVTVTWGGIVTPNANNTANNHTQVRFYATTDGGSTYYRHSTVTILPDANTIPATATLNDSTLDSALVTGAVLTYNSPPPPAKFMAKFQDKLVAGGAKTSNAAFGSPLGEQVVSNVLYYSLTDQPEHWPRNLIFNTATNAIPFKDQDGDELVGAIQVNRVLLVGLNNSVWTINNLPIVGVDPLFDFSTLKDRITNTHGFISTYCYTSLNLSDDEDAVFYVSQRGFHLNNGVRDTLLSGDIKWDSTIYNTSQASLIHVTNDTSNYIIVVGFPSVSSNVVDSAYVYHYHPSHIGEDGIGKITGPWDYNLATSTLVLRSNNTKELWGVSGSTTVDNSIVKLVGSTGYDYNGLAIPFEWETGWLRMSDDASARLREINFTVEEADAATLALSTSTLTQVVPQVKFLQLNSSGPVMKLLWDDDSVTVKQITGSTDELADNAGTLFITSTDRAIISVTVDAEVYGEEKTLADGSMIAS